MSVYRMHLYRQMGDWCLEDPNRARGALESVRSRYHDGKWTYEEKINGFWLKEDDLIAIRQIANTPGLSERDKGRRIGRYLQGRAA